MGKDNLNNLFGAEPIGVSTLQCFQIFFNGSIFYGSNYSVKQTESTPKKLQKRVSVFFSEDKGTFTF